MLKTRPYNKNKNKIIKIKQINSVGIGYYTIYWVLYDVLYPSSE